MIECYIVTCIVISCWWVIPDYFKRCLCTWRIIPVSKWLITMVIARPLRIGLWDPFQMSFSCFSWPNWDDPPRRETKTRFQQPQSIRRTVLRSAKVVSEDQLFVGPLCGGQCDVCFFFVSQKRKLSSNHHFFRGYVKTSGVQKVLYCDVWCSIQQKK